MPEPGGRVVTMKGWDQVRWRRPYHMAPADLCLKKLAL